MEVYGCVVLSTEKVSKNYSYINKHLSTCVAILVWDFSLGNSTLQRGQKSFADSISRWFLCKKFDGL